MIYILLDQFFTWWCSMAIVKKEALVARLQTTSPASAGWGMNNLPSSERDGATSSLALSATGSWHLGADTLSYTIVMTTMVTTKIITNMIIMQILMLILVFTYNHTHTYHNRRWRHRHHHHHNHNHHRYKYIKVHISYYMIIIMFIIIIIIIIMIIIIIYYHHNHHHRRHHQTITTIITTIIATIITIVVITTIITIVVMIIMSYMIIMFALASPGTHQNQTFEQNNLLPAKKKCKAIADTEPSWCLFRWRLVKSQQVPTVSETPQKQPVQQVWKLWHWETYIPSGKLT